MNAVVMLGMMVLMLVFFHRGRHHRTSSGHTQAPAESRAETPRASSEDRQVRSGPASTPTSEPADTGLQGGPDPGVVPPAGP